MSDIAQDKLKRLLDALYLNTKGKKIPWQVTFDDVALEADIGKSRVRLEEQTTMDFGTYIELTVRNSLGNVVDTITAEALDGVASPFEEAPNYARLLRYLYTNANRQARGADEAIDDILDSLES